MKEYILAATVASVLFAITVVAQTSYSDTSVGSTSTKTMVQKSNGSERNGTNVVNERQTQIDADLRERVRKLEELVESYKLQLEELRLYVFCRTSMRPELCVEPER